MGTQYICYGPFENPARINAARPALILTGDLARINTGRSALMRAALPVGINAADLGGQY